MLTRVGTTQPAWLLAEDCVEPWNEICAAFGVKVRPHDLRHHALTKLAEKNPEQVVLKIAGHVSPQMRHKVYAHVRLPALRAGSGQHQLGQP